MSASICRIMRSIFSLVLLFIFLLFMPYHLISYLFLVRNNLNTHDLLRHWHVSAHISVSSGMLFSISQMQSLSCSRFTMKSNASSKNSLSVIVIQFNFYFHEYSSKISSFIFFACAYEPRQGRQPSYTVCHGKYQARFTSTSYKQIPA